jgi:hypothetical protein
VHETAGGMAGGVLTREGAHPKRERDFRSQTIIRARADDDAGSRFG